MSRGSPIDSLGRDPILLSRCCGSFGLRSIPSASSSDPAGPPNDTGVQRRAREGAQRPTRPSDCDGGLAGIVDAPKCGPFLIGHHPSIDRAKDSEQTVRVRTFKEYERAPIVKI
jgi:hypothetical protein